MSAGRVRLSVLADELGLDFPELFRRFCTDGVSHLIDDNLTVPAAWLPFLKYYQRHEINLGA